MTALLADSQAELPQHTAQLNLRRLLCSPSANGDVAVPNTATAMVARIATASTAPIGTRAAHVADPIGVHVDAALSRPCGTPSALVIISVVVLVLVIKFIVVIMVSPLDAVVSMAVTTVLAVPVAIPSLRSRGTWSGEQDQGADD